MKYCCSNTQIIGIVLKVLIMDAVCQDLWPGPLSTPCLHLFTAVDPCDICDDEPTLIPVLCLALMTTTVFMCEASCRLEEVQMLCGDIPFYANLMMAGKCSRLDKH